MEEVTRPGIIAVVCDSLRDPLRPYLGVFEAVPARWLFTDDPSEAVRAAASPLAVLPAFTETNAHRLRDLTGEHPGVSVLGVVNDLTGHATHRAIQHGAAWVLNTLLPYESCFNVLLTLVQAHAPRVRTPPQAWPVLPEEDERMLVELLCGTATITEIAQRLYCSERSLYRRLRALYSRLGVRGRAELRARMARQAERAVTR